MTLGKSYVCFHVLVYSYSVSLSFYPLQKWHSPEFGIPLESSDGVFDVALGNPSLLQCMCKSEHPYMLTFGLHPEDIAINYYDNTPLQYTAIFYGRKNGIIFR